MRRAGRVEMTRTPLASDVTYRLTRGGHDAVADLQGHPVVSDSVCRDLISLYGRSETRTKLRTNARRFCRTEPDVPRHQSCSEVR